MKIRFTVMQEGNIIKSYIKNCNYHTLEEELNKLNSMYPSYLDNSVKYGEVYND